MAPRALDAELRYDPTVSPRWYASYDEWPLVVIALDRPDGGDPLFSTFLQCTQEVMDRRERCVVVVDLTGSRADAQRRKAVADWIRDERIIIERYVRAAAIVAPIALHRGALTALQWVTERRLHLEWEPFPSRESAMAWARERALSIATEPPTDF